MLTNQRLNSERLDKVTLGELLDQFLDAAIEVSEADFGNIQLLDHDVLRIVSQRGLSRQFLDFFREVRQGESAICGIAFATRSRIIAEDVSSSELLKGTDAGALLLRCGIHALQSTPLLARSGQMYGMISTHYRRAKRLSERALRYLDLLARLAADSIECLEQVHSSQRTEKQRAAVSMANALAHRINNPLQALTNLLALIGAEQSVSKERQQLTRAAQEQLKRISDSVHQLFAVETDGNPVTTRSPAAKSMVLNSWKEIATYLGRGVRTVQRYESELSLPVRRPYGKSHSAVVAFTDELDRWLRTAPTSEPPQRANPQSGVITMKLRVDDPGDLRHDRKSNYPRMSRKLP